MSAPQCWGRNKLASHHGFRLAFCLLIRVLTAPGRVIDSVMDEHVVDELASVKSSSSHKASSRPKIGLWQVIVNICVCVLVVFCLVPTCTFKVLNRRLKLIYSLRSFLRGVLINTHWFSSKSLASGKPVHLYHNDFSLKAVVCVHAVGR